MSQLLICVSLICSDSIEFQKKMQNNALRFIQANLVIWRYFADDCLKMYRE